MQQYADAVLTPTGDAISGAAVTVTVAGTGAPAALYSDNGTTLLPSNVILTDSVGRYSFFAANDRYTVTITAAGYTTQVRDVILDDPLQDEIALASEYPSLQAAIDANYGKRLRVDAGTYAIPNGVTIVDAIELQMDADAVLDYQGAAAGTALGQKRAIRVEGSLGATTPLAADIAVGDRQVSFNTAGFAAGDHVLIKTTEPYMPGVTGSVASRGHLTKIKTIDSPTGATLVERSPFAYAFAQTGTVQKINMVDGVKITGGTILCGGVGSAHSGISAYCTLDLMVDGVRILGAEDVGVSTYYSVAPTVQNCRIEDCTSPGGAVGNTGYGVCFFNGTRDGLIRRNRFRRCRHPVSGGAWIISMHCRVESNISEDGGIGTTGYDCHEPTFWWSFTDNEAHGGDGGFLFRGQHVYARGNTVQGVEGNGFLIKTYDANPNGISGTTLIGNRVFNCGGSGINIEGESATQRIHDTTLIGNHVEGCEYHCLLMQFTDGVTSTGDTMLDARNSSGANGSVIRASGSVASDNKNIRIADVTVRAAQRHGIHLQFADDVSVSVREVSDVGRATSNCAAVFAESCVGLTIDGGTYKVTGTSSYAVLQFDKCDRLRVSNSTLIGAVGNASQYGIRWYNSGGGTNQVGVFTNCVVKDTGARGFYSTNSNRVVVTGFDADDSGTSLKILVEGVFESFVEGRDTELFVTMLGARGNGAANDTAAIQAALDITATTIVIPPGTFLASGLTSSQYRRTIVSRGGVLKGNVVDGTVLTVSGTDSDVSVIIDGDSKARQGIVVTGARSHVHHCRIENIYGTSLGADAIRATTNGGVRITDNFIRNVGALTNNNLGDSPGAARAIVVDSTTAATGPTIIARNVCDTISGEEGDAIQVLFYGGSLPYLSADADVIDNTIRNANRRAIKVQASDVRVARNRHRNTLAIGSLPNAVASINVIAANDVDVDDNDLDARVGFVGIQVTGSGGTLCENVRVRRNKVRGGTTVHCLYVDLVKDSEFDDNRFQDGTPAVGAQNASHCTLRGNTFRGGAGGAELDVTLLSTCDAWTVSGNVAQEGSRLCMLNIYAANSIVQNNHNRRTTGGMIRAYAEATKTIYAGNSNDSASATVIGNPGDFEPGKVSGSINIGAGTTGTELVISPAQLTADENNYDPTNSWTAEVMRISSDAPRSITGLANGYQGREVVLINIGTFDITLQHQSANSTSTNRFALGTSIVIGAQEAVLLRYDLSSARWFCPGRNT